MPLRGEICGRHARNTYRYINLRKCFTSSDAIFSCSAFVLHLRVSITGNGVNRICMLLISPAPISTSFADKEEEDRCRRRWNHQCQFKLYGRKGPCHFDGSERVGRLIWSDAFERIFGCNLRPLFHHHHPLKRRSSFTWMLLSSVTVTVTV